MPPHQHHPHYPVLREQWYDRGCFGTDTFRSAILRAARLPDSPVFIVQERSELARYELRDLVADAQVVASAMHGLGLTADDTIAVQMPNGREALLVYLATMLLGARILPVVSVYEATELTFILNDSGARALFLPDRWRSVDYLQRLANLGDVPQLRHVVVVGDDVPRDALSWPRFLEQAAGTVPDPASHPDSPAVMFYTSGTTGSPKGVVHSHNSLLWEVKSNIRQTRPGDVFLSPWPFGHVAGVLSILRPCASRQTSILLDKWNADLTASLIHEHRVVGSAGVPLFLNDLLDRARAGRVDLSCMKDYLLGSTSIPASLIEEAAEFGVLAYRCYGSSEHPTVSSGTPDDPLELRAHTDGPLLPAQSVRIVDDDDNDLPAGARGEILLQGPEQFLGYHDATQNDEVFTHDGWFRSGDIGTLSADGYLTIVDRKKDIIIRGGENLSAKEIEDVLVTHPGVSEIAVIAGPDPRLGEQVCAVVRPLPGARVSLDQLRDLVTTSGLAPQKRPERLMLVEEFPRTPAGKIKKHELRSRLGDGRPQ